MTESIFRRQGTPCKEPKERIPSLCVFSNLLRLARLVATQAESCLFVVNSLSKFMIALESLTQPKESLWGGGEAVCVGTGRGEKVLEGAGGVRGGLEDEAVVPLEHESLAGLS